jgi:hypothetical protein
MFADYVRNGITTAVIGIVGWAYHRQDALKQEVTAHAKSIAVLETRHDDLKELITQRFDGSDGRLERIERTLNGSLRKDS